MKKEIPLLFSTPMVQAIVDGRKTQTRRVIKNIHPECKYLPDCNGPGVSFMEPKYFTKPKDEQWVSIAQCPYGKPGDLLWVREKHKRLVNCETSEFAFWSYYADSPEGFHKKYPYKWKPSIHMPKDAARIWLEVTDVRVERLHDISEADAKAEGAPDTLKVDDFKLLKGLGNWPIPKPFHQHQFGFLALWCKINGCPSWLQNPWVWVVSFKVLSTTGKPQSHV